jgi:hypothetical protein
MKLLRAFFQEAVDLALEIDDGGGCAGVSI